MTSPQLRDAVVDNINQRAHLGWWVSCVIMCGQIQPYFVFLIAIIYHIHVYITCICIIMCVCGVVIDFIFIHHDYFHQHQHHYQAYLEYASHHFSEKISFFNFFMFPNLTKQDNIRA